MCVWVVARVCVWVWVSVCIFSRCLTLHIYIYIYIYIRGEFNKFTDFFVQPFKIVVDSWKCSIAISLMRWLTNFYDFRFKWTATAAFGIHSTKAGLSQLVNFKNAIWHFRRTICDEIIFQTWKKCHRNVWNASDCFSTILHKSSISFWVA